MSKSVRRRLRAEAALLCVSEAGGAASSVRGGSGEPVLTGAVASLGRSAEIGAEPVLMGAASPERGDSVAAGAGGCGCSEAVLMGAAVSPARGDSVAAVAEGRTCSEAVSPARGDSTEVAAEG
ncbi:hypothetical protein ACQKGO_21690 [Corallococcus interemptor]|uniref:hypothetical protein n=1 Tax=Corallococcus interemptor TaxID=2316720 RepID=UPI003CFE2B7E